MGSESQIAAADPRQYRPEDREALREIQAARQEDLLRSLLREARLTYFRAEQTLGIRTERGMHLHRQAGDDARVSVLRACYRSLMGQFLLDRPNALPLPLIDVREHLEVHREWTAYVESIWEQLLNDGDMLRAVLDTAYPQLAPRDTWLIQGSHSGALFALDLRLTATLESRFGLWMPVPDLR